MHMIYMDAYPELICIVLICIVLLPAHFYSAVGIPSGIPFGLAAAGKIPPSEIVPLCVVQILAALVALEIYKRVNF